MPGFRAVWSRVFSLLARLALAWHINIIIFIRKGRIQEEWFIRKVRERAAPPPGFQKCEMLFPLYHIFCLFCCEELGSQDPFYENIQL